MIIHILYNTATAAKRHRNAAYSPPLGSSISLFIGYQRFLAEFTFIFSNPFSVSRTYQTSPRASVHSRGQTEEGVGDGSGEEGGSLGRRGGVGDRRGEEGGSLGRGGGATGTTRFRLRGVNPTDTASETRGGRPVYMHISILSIRTRCQSDAGHTRARSTSKIPSITFRNSRASWS